MESAQDREQQEAELPQSKEWWDILANRFDHLEIWGPPSMDGKIPILKNIQEGSADAYLQTVKCQT